MSVVNELMKTLCDTWDDGDDGLLYDEKNISALCCKYGAGTFYFACLRSILPVYSYESNWKALYEHVEEALTQNVELLVHGLELRMLEILANMTYERRVVKSDLMVVPQALLKDIKSENGFKNGVEMDYPNFKLVLKLMQATPDKHALMVGMPQPGTPHPLKILGHTMKKPALFYRVKFFGRGDFSMSACCASGQEDKLFVKRGGLYRLDVDVLRNVDKSVAKVISSETVTGIIHAVVEQRHGAILVFGPQNVIEKETKRLVQANRATQCQYDLNSYCYHDVLNGHSAIDGALLFDFSGKCHAFGAILDGVAEYGELSRGSRYNSSATYVKCVNDRYLHENPKRDVFAVIISDDGYIDFLGPKVKNL